jgi:hypothetical protein
MGIVLRAKLRTWRVVMQKSLMLKPAVVSVCDFIPHWGVLVLLMLFCVRALMCVSECFEWSVCCFVCFLCCVFDFLGGKKKEVKKETGLGLVNRKDENFGEWYSEVCFACFNGALWLPLSVLYMFDCVPFHHLTTVYVKLL